MTENVFNPSQTAINFQLDFSLFKRLEAALKMGVKNSPGMSNQPSPNDQANRDAGYVVTVLELAAQRLEKAERIMEQLNKLHLAALKNGFTGQSATSMLDFVSKSLLVKKGPSPAPSPAPSPEVGSHNKDSKPPLSQVKKVVSKVFDACIELDESLQFHDSHLSDDPLDLLHACLRVIGESSARVQAQRATIEILISLRSDDSI